MRKPILDESRNSYIFVFDTIVYDGEVLNLFDYFGEFRKMKKIDIGERIHELRGEKSLNSLANETGLQITQIRRIEEGSINPTFKTTERLLDALGYEFQIVLKQKEGQ